MASKKKSKNTTVADKDTVFAVIDDMVANLLIHDRDRDEDLPRGDIERLITNESLSIDDMVDKFRESLEEHLEDLTDAARRPDDDDDDGPGDLDIDEDEDDD